MIYVFTHDSIGVGEDGPTHQPIEQLASLRAIPGLIAHPPGRRQRGRRGVAARSCSSSTSRSALVLSRQAHARRSTAPKYAPAAGVAKGALRAGRRGRRQARGASCIATGSEVALCVDGVRAARRPRAISARVVSMPSWELFEQPGPGVPRHACCRPRSPRGSRSSRRRTFGWERYVGRRGRDDRHARPSAPRRRSRSCRRSSASRRARRRGRQGPALRKRPRFPGPL